MLRNQPIVDVRIDGDAGETTAPPELSLPDDARLTRSLIRALIERLLESGRWAEVQVHAEPVGPGNGAAQGGARLVIRVRARWHLTRISVVGNDVLSDSEALRAMQIREGTELKREQLAEIRVALRAEYIERGYEGVHIAFELRDTDDATRKALVVRITEGEPTRILGVSFDGTAPPRAARVRRALGFSSGDIYNRREVDEGLRDALEALRSRRWYAARLGPIRVERVEGGVQLNIRSVPGPRYRVVVHGAYPLTREAVEEALNVGDERLSPGAAQAMATRVLDLYSRRGHPDAEVDVRRVPARREGEALLVVRVRAGQQLRVVETMFPGASHFDDDFLMEQVRGFLADGVDLDGLAESVDDYTADWIVEGPQRGRETPRPLRVHEIYYERAYEEAVEHIARLYENAGYLHAQVGPAELERWERGRAVVRIPIAEGPQAHVYEMRLRGNDSIGDDTLLTASQLERGVPFSRQLVEEARRRVQNTYREEGYLYARVTPSIRFSGDRTRAEITFEIVEVFPVVVGEVRIRGARRTSERILRDLVRMEEGTRFRPSDVRRTQEALMGLGVFTSVTVEPADPTLPERVKPVVITVSERRSQMLDFRAGISTAEGVRGGFEYGYRNLFGWAIGLTLRVQLANQFFLLDESLAESFRSLSLADRLERRITLGLVLPYLPGLPNTGASLSVTHQRENERAFGLDSNKLDLTLTNRPVRWATLTFSAGIESNNVQQYDNVDDSALDAALGDPRLRALLLVPRGRSTLVAAEVTASVDRRDNPFNPTRGFFASVSAEWARSLRTETVRVGGEEERFFSHHVRTELTLNGYVPLGPVTLALQGRVGRVFHLEARSQTYPNRQFFVGGVDSVRGYRQDSMLPQEVVDEGAGDEVIVQGGDVFMVTRAELRFPIVGIFYGGAFADFGNVWGTAGNLNPLELRPTAGLGIRLATPVGPIAFDYGFLLARREGVNNEGLGSFHFSIGLF